MEFTGKGLPMTGRGMSSVCDLLSCGEPEIWAILTVETRGFGYLPDRRPRILFERHIFSRLTGRAFDAQHPDISNPTSGGYKGGAAEYDRLERAMMLDIEHAMASASWGLPQVMGFNHDAANYPTVGAMVDAMVASEDNQLAALANFINHNPKCRIGVQRRDWTTFAACYNGRDFRRNDYDRRLEAAHAKAQSMLPDIELRAAQVALTYLGIDPGAVDGLRGRMTRGAILEYQTRAKLPPTGELDELTGNMLSREAFGQAGAAGEARQVQTAQAPR